MAARRSARRLPRYSLEFKRKAVRLTRVPGMEVQAVAEGRVHSNEQVKKRLAKWLAR